jgi:hypothetical protein
MSKRLANSPAEKTPSSKKNADIETPPKPPPKPPSSMPPKVTPPPEDTEGSLFKFEVIGMNNKTYYGSLAECEIILIWEKVLGRSREEIFAMSYNRSLTRNFRVTFKLNQPILPADVYPEPTFTYIRKSSPTSESEDVFQCKIIGYTNVKPVEIGQLTRVTAKTNDFSVTPEEIVAWLSKFGSVSVNHQDYERNSMGLRSDVFETEIVLARHIPEYLPIAGRKIQINYPGIPRACNNCFQTGHMKRNCKSKKVGWIHRVNQLYKSGEFEDSLFGGWIAILEREFA